MRKVYFQRDEELTYCCEVLFQCEKTINIVWEKEAYWNNVMIFEEDAVNKETLIHCFVQIYLTYRLQEKIKEIAQTVYLYDDATSLQQIYTMTRNVLEERYFVTTIFPEESSFYTALYTLFDYQLSHVKHIHFDAFILFSMKSLEASLIKAVGCGIDEIQREEEHKQFIAKAHQFVLNRSIQTEEVYLLVQDKYTLFQEDGLVYSQQKLVNKIKSSPIYMLQLDENEQFLAPIIALAPKKIYVFTEHPIDAKVDSLCQIFKDRIQLYQPSAFPFASKVN